ncbi:hypothetical protein GCM10009416_33530 [Craurococcus roseus]|uniref:Uncharacterized protein n=1 Tax=Craurococcus roseus TaxID=77585 RepID=A0ABP3QQX7_9PROT
MAMPRQVLWQRRHSSMQACISADIWCILESPLAVASRRRSGGGALASASGFAEAAARDRWGRAPPRRSPPDRD